MKCDECNLCCELLQIDGTGSPAGKLCKRWDHAVRCKIYDKRPGQCSAFMCVYLLAEKAPLVLRPDKCGVVFERVASHIMLGTKKNRRKVNKVVMDQIKSFHEKGFAVVINAKNETTEIFLAKGMSKEDVKKEFQEKYGTKIL